MITISKVWITRGASLPAQPDTPMPPDQVTCLPEASGIFHHGLSVRCVQMKGVNNLPNRTLPVAGTSGSTEQVWGLPEQDWIYGRLRRLKFPTVVSTTKYSLTAIPNRATTLACSNMHNQLGLIMLHRDHPSASNGISLMPAPAS